MSARPLAVCALSLALYVACSDERPPRIDDRPAAGGSDGAAQLRDADSGCDPTPGLVDTTDMCGDLVLETEHETVNLYFVVDRSGSMVEPLEGSVQSKYYHARAAIAEVLGMVGHRVRYGAAVFPGFSLEDECSVGGEVFATQPGDHPACVPEGEQGPVLRRLLFQLAGAGTGIGTPTAPTLMGLLDTLTELEGKTSVILVTDGAPNCNPDAVCSAEDCALTNSGFGTPNGAFCTTSFNCCDPNNVFYGPDFCHDTAGAEAAVQALADEGIQTFVVGMPGSEDFASHLGRLAEIGGTARQNEPRYYPVTNTTELSEVLREIGASLALSCDITLGEPPPDPGQVNVYFDSISILSDPEDGWSWADETTIRLNGWACDILMDGGVYYVQVVSGCPTFVE